ncbi:MAG: hypothetical protein E4H36_00405 [Spirochaetales bacterium]|nr:MAG: hypothetical protein E4H36_00405 [Spirochaetales bacterium]
MKRLAGVIFLFLMAVSVFAQDSFSDWKKQQESAFKAYVEKQDKDFADFMKKEWEQFQAFKGISFDTTPKPVMAPAAPVTNAQGSVGGKALAQKEVDLSSPALKTEITKSGYENPAAGTQNIKVDFLGRTLYVPYSAKLDIPAAAPYTNTQFSNSWTAMSGWDFKPFIAELKKLKDSLQLNDWGYFLLANAAGAGMFPADAGKSGIFTWFLLLKSGYECRICYFQKNVYLLIPAENMLYNTLYMSFTPQGPYYYLFQNNKPAQNVSNLYTYKDDYPGKNSLIKMRIETAPKLTEERNNRTVFFIYKGIKYKISLESNASYVLLGKNYPQTEIPVYFSSPPSAEARHSLINSLKLIVEGKSETEAANMILRFVQTAFEYKTDDEQFGIEKPLFIDETLFYPFADCEDRSILYSFLIRDILGLKVVGLDYPGHIATAVRFNSTVKGDAIVYKGERYVICDPTYINADIGMAMPDLKSVSPGIIDAQ